MRNTGRCIGIVNSLALYAAIMRPAYAWQVNTVLGISVQGGSAPIATVINQLLGILYSISGGAALLMILWGAYRYITAAGNAKTVQEAKDTIQSAFYGLLLILLAYLMANLIGGDALTQPNI